MCIRDSNDNDNNNGNNNIKTKKKKKRIVRKWFEPRSNIPWLKMIIWVAVKWLWRCLPYRLLKYQLPRWSFSIKVGRIVVGINVFFSQKLFLGSTFWRNGTALLPLWPHPLWLAWPIGNNVIIYPHASAPPLYQLISKAKHFSTGNLSCNNSHVYVPKSFFCQERVLWLISPSDFLQVCCFLLIVVSTNLWKRWGFWSRTFGRTRYDFETGPWIWMLVP